jgi:beta-ureidopropionase / N-carbamoyl-L-amino-acid hydrolase
MCGGAVSVGAPFTGGISHHWSEDTKEDDIVPGAQVFAGAVAGLIGGALH